MPPAMQARLRPRWAPSRHHRMRRRGPHAPARAAGALQFGRRFKCARAHVRPTRRWQPGLRPRHCGRLGAGRVRRSPTHGACRNHDGLGCGIRVSFFTFCGPPFDPGSGWTNYTAPNMPQQRNGHDCGMFALLAAECVVRDVSLNITPFAQEHVPTARMRVAHTIVSNLVA